MSNVDQALATQLGNIQKKTGKTLHELHALIGAQNLGKHGEIRDWLKSTLGLGHGDANTLTHEYFKAKEPAGPQSGDDVLAAIYAGPKEALRPIHEALLAKIAAFGPFETAPTKAYVSLRRKKQFATVGPATRTRVEVGLNMKGVPGTARLQELPPGGMCQYRVDVTAPREVDAELLAWIRRAYDAAG